MGLKDVSAEREAHTAKRECDVQFRKFTDATYIPKTFAFRKAVAAPYSYFTPEAGGANGEGYHNFNHTFYQQPVLNVTLTTWRAAAQAAVEMRAR